MALTRLNNRSVSAVTALPSGITIPSGSITSASLPSGSVINYTLVYNSSTEISTSTSSTQLGSKDFYYWSPVKIGGTFTKLESTSKVIVGGWYYYYEPSNAHDGWLWAVGYENQAYHLGFDIYALSGEDGPSPRRQSGISYSVTLDYLPAGSNTVYVCAGTGDGRSSGGGVLNRNPANTSADMSSNNTQSQMWVLEVKA